MNTALIEFQKDFQELLDKYSIKEVVLVNDDNSEMGYRQMDAIMDYEGKRHLCMRFSGSGKALCPECGRGENEDH